MKEGIQAKPKSYRLTKFKGSPTVLYFYPKDHTPCCSMEAEDFSKHFKDFKKLGLKIFGISRDSEESHEKFRAKLKIPFELISDVEESLCKKLEVIQWKSLYGRKFLGIERSTFLLDGNGKVVFAWRKVKVKGHATEVLLKAKELFQS